MIEAGIILQGLGGSSVYLGSLIEGTEAVQIVTDSNDMISYYVFRVHVAASLGVPRHA